MIQTGWPANIVNIPRILHDYWKVKHNLHIADQLIFMKDRLNKKYNCPVCAAYSKQNQKEPLLPHPIPTRP